MLALCIPFYKIPQVDDINTRINAAGKVPHANSLAFAMDVHHFIY